MDDAWQVIKPYADETAELRAEIKTLRRMIDAANAAFADLAERHVHQSRIVEEQAQRLNELYAKLEDVFGEL